MTKFFKIKKKKLFKSHFSRKEIFLKPPAMYNCSGSPAFKFQRSRVDWPSNQKLFYPYQDTKIIQSICLIHQVLFEIHMI